LIINDVNKLSFFWSFRRQTNLLIIKAMKMFYSI